MKKIILVGTGNLGKRYLQAILAAEGDLICHCYDINPEMLDGVEEFLKKNNISRERLKIHYKIKEILGEINSQSLVIVATTANGRHILVSQIIQMHPEVMIIEKPVTQTAEDYLAILDELRQTDIPAFTHYTLRFQPFCKVLREMIRKEESFELISVLPAMGLACVSIHYIDLFLWLFNINAAELTAYDFHGAYEQKRKGFYDMYGEIIINIPGRGTGHFINSELNSLRSLVIGLTDQVISVFEDQRIMTVVNRKDNNSISRQEVKYRFASQYLTPVIENYLNDDINASGELVSLEEGYISHKILFDYMELTGNRDLNIT